MQMRPHRIASSPATTPGSTQPASSWNTAADSHPICLVLTFKHAPLLPPSSLPLQPSALSSLSSQRTNGSVSQLTKSICSKYYCCVLESLRGKPDSSPGSCSVLSGTLGTGLLRALTVPAWAIYLHLPGVCLLWDPFPPVALFMEYSLFKDPISLLLL